MLRRLRWIDTVRGVLAFLVLLGHAIVWSGVYAHIKLFRFIFFFVSTFHMGAFYAVSGYIFGRKKQYSGALEEKFDWLEVLKRVIDLLVPTVVSMVITFCVVITLGRFPFRQAVSGSLFWFMWVMSAITVGHYVLTFCFKKEHIRLMVLSVLTLVFGLSINVLGKFFGYFLLYELGHFLGVKLTDKSEKNFFKLSRGVIIGCFSAMLIYLGYVHGEEEILVLQALYKIPIGVLMSYSICSVILNCPTPNFFILAGRFTLQIYLFQYVTSSWMKTYTPSLPLYFEIIIFIGMVLFNYCVPVLLANKYKDTAIYHTFFCAGKYLFHLEHSKVS